MCRFCIDPMLAASGWDKNYSGTLLHVYQVPGQYICCCKCIMSSRAELATHITYQRAHCLLLFLHLWKCDPMFDNINKINISCKKFERDFFTIETQIYFLYYNLL